MPHPEIPVKSRYTQTFYCYLFGWVEMGGKTCNLIFGGVSGGGVHNCKIYITVAELRHWLQLRSERESRPHAPSIIKFEGKQPFLSQTMDRSWFVRHFSLFSNQPFLIIVYRIWISRPKGLILRRSSQNRDIKTPTASKPKKNEKNSEWPMKDFVSHLLNIANFDW